MDLREVFTPAAIAANWIEVASNQIPYLGATLFPARKKAGLDLSWLKGSRGLPVSLMPSAFDAKATFRDRIGFEKLETEMPFFREGYKIKEKDRQEMLRVQESTDPYAAEVIARVFDDILRQLFIETRHGKVTSLIGGDCLFSLQLFQFSFHLRPLRLALGGGGFVLGQLAFKRFLGLGQFRTHFVKLRLLNVPG